MKEYLVQSSKAALRYHDLSGAGAPILFIHGLGCASSLDYPQVAAADGLPKHRRILVDLLGSAFSDKPEEFEYSIESHAVYLQEFVEHLKLDEFYLFGHSMGGSIAISLARRCEKRLKGILISEANLDSGGGFFSRRIAKYGEKAYRSFGHDETIREAREGASTNWAAGLESSSPVAIYREALSLVEGTSPSWRKTLHALNIPKTFICGEQSLPDPDVSDLEQHDVRIEIVRNAGHSMAWESPEGVAAAIVNGIRFSDSRS